MEEEKGTSRTIHLLLESFRDEALPMYPALYVLDMLFPDRYPLYRSLFRFLMDLLETEHSRDELAARHTHSLLIMFTAKAAGEKKRSLDALPVAF